MKTVVVENRSPVSVGNVPPGGRLKLPADEAGVPFDAFWRRRLRDAQLDGSLVMVSDAEPTDPPQTLPAPAPVATAEGTGTATSKQTKKEKTP